MKTSRWSFAKEIALNGEVKRWSFAKGITLKRQKTCRRTAWHIESRQISGVMHPLCRYINTKKEDTYTAHGELRYPLRRSSGQTMRNWTGSMQYWQCCGGSHAENFVSFRLTRSGASSYSSTKVSMASSTCSLHTQYMMRCPSSCRISAHVVSRRSRFSQRALR